jgi:hypothetical protein
LKVHSENVFGVSWNAFFTFLLESSFNDGSLKVLKIDENAAVTLEGHTNKTSPIIWNYDFVYIVHIV